MKHKKILVSFMFALLISAGMSYHPAYADNEACQDIDDLLGDIGFLECDDQDDIVSFSGFKSEGLQAPTGEGLDESLKQATNAREFILKAVNFALSFLGIIAVVIVIYGGFLYVTAAGNEEQAGKGKKSITYAAIGILIIIASYAIVSTLTTSLSGGEGGSLRGSSPTAGIEGSNIGQQAVYNLGAAEINTSLNEFIASYRSFLEINSLLKRLPAIPAPTSRAESRRYVSDVNDIITSIKNKSGPLSESKRRTQAFIDEIIFPLESQSSEFFTSERFNIDRGLLESDKDNYEEFAAEVPESGFSEDSERAEELMSSQLKREILTALNSDAYDLEKANTQDFNTSINNLIGASANPITSRPQTVSVDGRLPIVWKAMGAVADSFSAQAAGNNALEQGLVTPDQLKRAFSGIDPNITVGDLFKEAIEALHHARRIANDPADQNQLVIEATQALYRLYIIVKDIQFVYVRINASVQQGSAPLVVELSGLGSRDPSNKTIADEAYSWDPDGDGTPGVSSRYVDCGDADLHRPTIVCVYKQPGTYRVGLYIESQDKEHIAAGQTVFSVTVSPSLSRIILKAQVNDIESTLRSYEEDTQGKWQLTVDKQEFQVTTEEGRNGIDFDATASEGSSGSDQSTLRKEWTFGDGTPVVKDTDPIKHSYTKEGIFPLRLEVTDVGNRKDRKIVNISVASIAARFETSKDIAEPEEVIEFDGSISRSDHGTIRSYQWSILDTAASNKNIINEPQKLTVVGGTEASTLRVKFKNPGTYVVKLKVSDGSKSAETPEGEEIKIKSRKPRAHLVVRACPELCPDPGKPALVEFDASGSSDPDTRDELTYTWKFLNEIGEELKHPTGLTIEGNPQFPSKTAKKLRVTFSTTGTYRVILSVDDSHESDIRQEDTKEKTITIDSIVEASWSETMKSVVKLDPQTQGVVEFRGSAKNADRLEIDFGDGEVSTESLTPDAQGVATFNISKTYTQAGAYLVTATAISDDAKGSIVLRRHIHVAQGEAPLAVINVSVDNQPIVLGGEAVAEIAATRNKIITFDAGSSINAAGQSGAASGLRYSWNFGDGTSSTRAREQHSFGETSREGYPYTVILTVSQGNINVADLNRCAGRTGPCAVGGDYKESRAEFRVNIISKKPTVAALSLEKKTQGQTTPVEVLVAAEGAQDEDGRISNYQFWYYDPTEPDRKLSVVDTTSDRATLRVETSGEEGEEKEYIFCARLTDNTNLISECSELFDEDELPHLTVTNGPNKAPIAEFTVNDTSITVGDSVTFSSSSRDPDQGGRIVEYIWDVDGDGFHNDQPSTLASITHIYEKKSPQGGYRTKLKVIDDKGAAGYSTEIPLRVDPKSHTPTAQFRFVRDGSNARRVRFIDESRADVLNGARLTKWTWDFDTAQEFGCGDRTARPENCNRNKTDDIDATDQNPIFDLPEDHDIYQVQLIVEDSDGNISEPRKNLLDVRSISAFPGSATPTTGQQTLRAEIQTSPSLSFEAVPGCTPASSPRCRKKILHLPYSVEQPVTLTLNNSRGDITRYTVDQNIRCDSDFDGNQANDADFDSTRATNPRCVGSADELECTLNYVRLARTGHAQGVGHFTTRLTVTDSAGAVASEDLEIAFEEQTGATETQRLADRNASNNRRCDGSLQTTQSILSGSLFTGVGTYQTILIGLVAGLAIGLGWFGITSYIHRPRRRI